jgi:hypothetical protein
MFKFLAILFHLFSEKPQKRLMSPGDYKCVNCGGLLSQGKEVWVTAGAYSGCVHKWKLQDNK